MAEHAKNALWTRIFGTEKSGCCGVRIEEVTEAAAQASEDANEDVAETPTAEASRAARKNPQAGSCCGGAAPAARGKNCCG